MMWEFIKEMLIDGMPWIIVVILIGIILMVIV